MVKSIRLLVDAEHPAIWHSCRPKYKAGTIVPAIDASNIPRPGCMFIATPELDNDPYGVLVEQGEYQLISDD